MDENINSSSSFRIKNGILKASSSNGKARHSKSSIILGNKENDNSSEEKYYPERDISDGAAMVKKSSQVPSGCDCGPDFYTRVLGPTADETILTGLQTVIELCSKLRSCAATEGLGEIQRDSLREFEYPERDSGGSQTDGKDLRASKSQTDGRNIKTSKSQTDPNKILTSPSQTDPNQLMGAKSQTDPNNIKTSKSQTDPNAIKSAKSQTIKNMVSSGWQIKPSVTNQEIQTALYPEMVSEILQTIGFDPETASKIIQTSFMSVTGPDKTLNKTSLASIFMQTSNPSLHSYFMQTTNPDLLSGVAQTSAGLLPTIVEEKKEPETILKPPSTSTIGTQSEVVATAVKSTMVEKTGALKRSSLSSSSNIGDQATTGDEHNMISPPEPPLKKKVCKCCKCGSSAKLRKESKVCVCHGKKRHSRTSSHSSLGGSRNKRGPPEEVKYAITKISKFRDFTTFEVMRSTRKVPSYVPETVESVFVIKKQKDKKNGNGKEKMNGKENGNANYKKNGNGKERINGSGMDRESIKSGSIG